MLKKAAAAAGPVILEPVMRLQLEVDSAHLRAVLSDLTGRRRGAIDELSQDKHFKQVDARVPLKVFVSS